MFRCCDDDDRGLIFFVSPLCQDEPEQTEDEPGWGRQTDGSKPAGMQEHHPPQLSAGPVHVVRVPVQGQTLDKAPKVQMCGYCNSLKQFRVKTFEDLCLVDLTLYWFKPKNS